MDTRDVLNLTYGDLSVPLPRKNLRMRFNDTLLHIPPIMINSISNALLRFSLHRKYSITSPCWVRLG